MIDFTEQMKEAYKSTESYTLKKGKEILLLDLIEYIKPLIIKSISSDNFELTLDMFAITNKFRLLRKDEIIDEIKKFCESIYCVFNEEKKFPLDLAEKAFEEEYYLRTGKVSEKCCYYKIYILEGNLS